MANKRVLGGVCMSINVEFESNLNEIQEEFKKRKKLITYAWGLKWQKLSVNLITRNGIVDTGRLRASLTFITVDKVGKPIRKSNKSKPEDFLGGSSGEDETLVVGSNVPYAKKNEMFNPKGAFILPAITNYRKSYENITKAIMESPSANVE